MILLTLLPLALAAKLPPYRYTLSDTAAPNDPAAYKYTTWPVKTMLYAANGNTAVFYAAGGDRSTTLGFGDVVKVEEVGATEQIDDRVDSWYRVSGARSGWVFGGDLTPYRWEADLDGDGEKELATAAWRSDFSVRVRVFEPNLRAGATMQLDVEAAGGAFLSQSGSDLTADLVPASKAGIPLIHLHLGVEACADFRDDWISYTSEGTTKIGQEHVALSLLGLMDPPSSSTFKVEFSGKRSTAYVERETAKQDDSGTSIPPEITHARYVLRNGVYYQEKDGAVSR